MTKNSTLIVVDDDADDQEMIKLALEDLGLSSSQVKFFREAQAALDFLYEANQKPFLIVSDINMPKIDGLKFKETIESCSVLKGRSIPFVFLSTASSKTYINRAYELRAQGFFEKGTSYEDLKASLNAILDYWNKSKFPN